MRKIMDWSIAGQMDLFEYMANMPTKEQQKSAENVLNFTDKKQKIVSAAEEYLKKGERLTSLAREKYGRMIERLSFSKVEEKLFSIKVSKYDLYGHLVPKIATTVVRPLLRALTTCDENDEALTCIKSLVDYDIDIRKVDMKSEGWHSANYVLKRISDQQLCFTLKEERYEPLVVYGLQNNAHPKNRKNVLYKDSSVCGDIAEIVAWLICFTQYSRALANEDLIPAIRYKLDNRLDPVPPMKLLYEAVIRANGDEGQWVDGRRDIRVLFDNHKAFLGIPLQKYRQPSETALMEFCKTVGADYDAIIRDHGMSRDSAISRNKIQIAEDGSPFMYMLSSELDIAFGLIDPINWVKTERGKLCYQDFVNKFTRNESERQKNDPDFVPIMWSEPFMYSGLRSYVLENMEAILELVFENYSEKVKTLEYLNERKSRAKVYQTKKNIPDKVVKEMQESEYNSYFGYVEFDEECDLSKVSEICDEFIAFKETYIKKLDTSKVSIRFRKLGNYKAAGLYFPEIGCLCVDFRHPDSFVHEYGHCIDNTCGGEKNLSDQEEFYRTYYAYRSAFRSALSKNGAKLTGKYNKDYYLMKTEVFARCFEMYVTRTLRMQNSICKPDSKIDFAYPDDEKLMENVNEYFSGLFETLNTDEEVAA